MKFNLRRLNGTNLFWIFIVHLGGLFALPYFSWERLGMVLIGTFLLAPIGINVGYHRLLSHRSFTTSRFLQNALATLGALIGAGPPLHWAAMHRVHHRYSDTKSDPHDSNRGFWYSHIFHLFVKDEAEVDNYVETYVPDLAKDPYLLWLNRWWIWLAFATLPVLYWAGGIGHILWGGFLRLGVMWHVMWFVNSASHLWGYRNYDSADRSRNCWWVGILAAGEGWHNNHHAHPSCAAHGHRWWEFDFSFQIIRALEGLGLVWNVKRPRSIERSKGIAPA